MASLWLEPELEALLSLVHSLDAQLHEVAGKGLSTEGADERGYFDVAEHITGLAFVACQTYIATVCGAVGIYKSAALLKGPQQPKSEASRVGQKCVSQYKYRRLL